MKYTSAVFILGFVFITFGVFSSERLALSEKFILEGVACVFAFLVFNMAFELFTLSERRKK